MYASLHFPYDDDDDDDNDDKNNYLLKFNSLSLICYFGSAMANYRSINKYIIIIIVSSMTRKVYSENLTLLKNP